MAEPGLPEIMVSTGRNRQLVVRDAITNNNAVLEAIDEEGGFIEEEGGRTVIEETLFDDNGTFKRYEGGEILNIGYNPVLTAFEYPWKQWSIAVVMTGAEKRMNAGDDKLIKLLGARWDAAEATLANKLNLDLLSDGTADGGKQIAGLKHLISKTPTAGTVGGIDRSTTGGAFARNFKFDTINDTSGGAPGGVATNSGNITDYWDWCMLNTDRNGDGTKVIIAGTTHFRAYKSSLKGIQRITDVGRVGKSGYKRGDLYYDGIRVVHGGGVSFGGEALVQADQSYGLNPKFLKFRYLALNEALENLQSINQDAWAQLIVGMGNMTGSLFRVQWTMFDS